MRKLVLLTCILFSLLQLSAQSVDKPEYSLLWELRSPDLAAPSYLFGTMHVQDERAFEFSDSVLIALENTAAFAMEMHPDSMMLWFMDIALSKNKNNLKQDLSPEAYEKLEEEFLKKTGTELDSLDVEDPMMIEMMLTDFEEPEYTEKRDNIVDLYLFKAAFYAGKSMYGLEKMSDYDNVTRAFFKMFEKENTPEFDTAPEDQTAAYESMIEIYQSGNLSRLHDYVTRGSADEDFDAAMLDTRNIKMADGITTLAKSNGSVFSAVGAAHLLGENGVLQMLRDKGWTVRPVQGTFTGLADKYKIKKNRRRDWNTYTVHGSTQINLPNAPKEWDISDLGDIPEGMMQASITFDMLEMNMFMIMDILLPMGTLGDDPKQKQDFLKNISAAMLDGEGIKNYRLKPVKQADGTPAGFETNFKDNQGNYQKRHFHANKRGITVLAYVHLMSSKPGTGSKPFFDSFQAIDVPPPPPSIKDPKNKEAFTFSSQKGAYQITFPGSSKTKIVDNQLTDEDGIQFSLRAHQQIAVLPDGSTFLSQYVMQPLGRTADNDSLMLYTGLSAVAKSLNVDKQPTPTEKDGRPALSLDFDRGAFAVKTLIFQRGSRTHYLAAFVNKDDVTVADDFFDSFEFLPNEFVPVSRYQPEGQNFSVIIPEELKFTFTPDEEDIMLTGEAELMAFDSLSGINYSLSRIVYSDYAQIESEEEFYEELYTEYKEHGLWKQEEDSVRNNRRELLYSAANNKGQGVTYIKSFLTKEAYYEMMTYIPEKKFEEKAFDFFNSFRFEESEISADVSDQNKSDDLINNLFSKNTKKREDAIVYINTYEFAQTDLPLIYDALENKTMVQDTVEELLIREFIYNQDARTLDYLKSYFAKTENTNIQIYILEALNRIDSSEGRNTFFALAKDWQKENTETLSNYQSVFQVYYDSLSYVEEHLDAIFSLYEHPQFSYRVSHLLWQQATDLSPELTAPYRERILAEVQKFAEENNIFDPKQEEIDFPEYFTFDALNLYLADSEYEENTEAWFKEFTSCNDAYLVLAAIRYYAFQQIPFNTEMAKTVFDDPYQRIFLYQYAVDAFGDVNGLPKKYQDRETMVQAYAYQSLGSEYGTLSDYELLEKRKYNYAGKDLVLHLFTFEFEDNDNTYFGVISQPADGTLNVYPTLFDYITDAWTKKDTDSYLKILQDYWEKEGE